MYVDEFLTRKDKMSLNKSCWSFDVYHFSLIVNNLRTKLTWVRKFLFLPCRWYLSIATQNWNVFCFPDQHNLNCERIIEKICLLHTITVVKSHFNYLINAPNGRESSKWNNEINESKLNLWGHLLSWLMNNWW